MPIFLNYENPVFMEDIFGIMDYFIFRIMHDFTRYVFFCKRNIYVIRNTHKICANNCANNN